MTAQTNESQSTPPVENKPSDKEINFQKQRGMYERMLAEKEEEIKRLHQSQQQRVQAPPQVEEEEEEDPYVDSRYLNKKLNSFKNQMEKTIDERAEKKANMLLKSREKDDWLKRNGDFYDVMQNHAEEFARRDPELAETILSMPEGFERQKLVYKNIKALGIDKPAPVKNETQERIDRNQRTPYYQPSGQGTMPYTSQGNFSPQGQKEAYNKIQELKNRLTRGGR